MSKRTSKMSRRESDLGSLREEREANAFPFSRTPFVPEGVPVLEDEEELEKGELRVKAPEEVPWIDLLLEIAMTTAFASLTDGTPILQWDNALSYVCYFVFVWWIWVAQVAYNMRFRQADWLHRIWVFAQLIVFSALAAFTKDFDVTNGLANDSDNSVADLLFSQLGNSKKTLAASNFRNERLPRLNARGASFVMGVSRLVLLVQYSVVFMHAKRHGHKVHSVLSHMVALLFSSLCYFGVFISLGIASHGDKDEPAQFVEISKVVFWYLPILAEIAVHFVALRLPGWVRYSTESVYARSGTVFLIILGAGLDKITSGFQAIVGNTGLGKDGIPVFVAAAVIFIGYFSLYFGTPGSTRELSNRRAITWFFCQFFFLAALIVTLQGIATNLAFTNLWGAVKKSDDALQPIFDWMTKHHGVNVSANSFPDSRKLFNKLGIALDDIVDDLNMQITWAIEGKNEDIITTAAPTEEMVIVNYILDTFEALPDDGSLLSAKLQTFIQAAYGNTTAVNMETFFDLRSDIVKDRASSALWFYASAGSTILALVLTSLVKGLPRDKWEWGVITTRFIFGSGICALTFLDLGSSNPVFDSGGNETDSKIWRIVVGRSHLLLIILAIVMGCLQVIEHLFAYAANRGYHSFDNINFLKGPVERRRTQRAPIVDHRYQRTPSDSDTLPLTPYSYSDHKSGDVDTMPMTPYSYSDHKVQDSMYSDPYDPHPVVVQTAPHGLYSRGSA